MISEGLWILNNPRLLIYKNNASKLCLIARRGAALRRSEVGGGAAESASTIAVRQKMVIVTA